MTFTLSSDAKIDLQKQGDEEQPIIIIDRACDTPEQLIDEAASQNFAQIGPFFPGLRAPTPANYLNGLSDELKDLINEVFGFTAQGWRGECYYSLVTTPPGKLAPIQRIPHHDGAENNLIAVLHYLAKPAQGGTAFFRHKSTGYETVTQERFSHYSKTLEADARRSGLPPARYAEDGGPLFERIASYEGLFNRLLIYRGVTLHSGIIDNEAPLSTDPRQGRLTVNAFLEPV